jgi:hypothetical protein
VKWVAGGDRTRGRGPAGRVASSGSATTDELVPQAGLGATAAEAGEVGEAGLGDAWSRGAWVWDAAFYALLALAAGAALLAGNQSPRERLLTVGLVLLLALWHRVASRRVPADQDTIRDALVYVAGVYLLWFALVSVDTVFFLMLWVLYPWTFRLLPIRAGIAAALVLTGLVTWRELTIPGLSVDERIGTASTSAVAAIAGVLFAIWINRIINQSAERRQLIEQLTSTRLGMVVSGRGLAYSTALELALKLEETCYLPAIGLSHADLVHGPIAVLGPGTPALLVAAGDGPVLPGMTELARSVAQRGARAYGIGGDDAFKAACSAALPGPDLPEALAPLALVVPGQLLVEALARRLGLDPDRPRGLTKVTQTEGEA